MKASIGRKRAMLLVFLGGAIPSIIILGHYFGLSSAVSIPVIVLLTLATSATALWIHANRHVDGHGWWQDDSTSGWRGY